MCGKPKQRKNEGKLRLRLPASMRKWQTGQMLNGGQALNGLACENKNLKQLGFNVQLRKSEPQRRKPHNLGREGRLGSTKSNGQSIHKVLMPGDMLNMLLHP